MTNKLSMGDNWRGIFANQLRDLADEMEKADGDILGFGLSAVQPTIDDEIVRQTIIVESKCSAFEWSLRKRGKKHERLKVIPGWGNE